MTRHFGSPADTLTPAGLRAWALYVLFTVDLPRVCIVRGRT